VFGAGSDGESHGGLRPRVPLLLRPRLCAALANVGIRTVAASVLFLRPSVVGSLRRRFKDRRMLDRLLHRFGGGESLAIHAGDSRVRALPRPARLEIYRRLRTIAERLGLSVLVCACKNPDIASGTCHISGRRTPPMRREDSHLRLFEP
jgi:hypothetical protein